MRDYALEFPAAQRNVKGRGTGSLIKSRFNAEQIFYSEEDSLQIKTEIYKDLSKSIIARNDSPDVGFNATINPYRGCEHGCVYCYARPTHEYLGLSSGLDFETKIFAKMDAPQLLADALSSRRYKPEVLGMSGVTDCYQPIERHLKLTQQCLRVLADFRHPVIIITKNFLVTRDIDILQELAHYHAIHVIISITTLDEELAQKMEPRASTPSRRLRAIENLHAANIPVSVNMAPLIPGLTDHEIPMLLQEAKARGARSAHYVMLRLPFAVKDLFSEWLTRHYPTKRDKVLHKLDEMHSGKVYDARFGTRMTGTGAYAKHIAQMFAHWRSLHRLDNSASLSVEHFKVPSSSRQLSLF